MIKTNKNSSACRKQIALKDRPLLSPIQAGGLDAFNGTQVDVAVTMGCGDECPMVLAKERLDWKIPDPRDMSPEEFRAVRDLIGSKVKSLVEGLLADAFNETGALAC